MQQNWMSSTLSVTSTENYLCGLIKYAQINKSFFISFNEFNKNSEWENSIAKIPDLF